MTTTTTTPKKLALGARVLFSATLQRRHVTTPRRAEKHWLPQPREGKGILVGYRTISNGYAAWEGPEEGTSWNPTAHLRCALVAVSLHKNPVHVPLESLAPELTLPLE